MHFNVYSVCSRWKIHDVEQMRMKVTGKVSEKVITSDENAIKVENI